jgi:hypothetical protein
MASNLSAIQQLVQSRVTDSKKSAEKQYLSKWNKFRSYCTDNGRPDPQTNIHSGSTEDCAAFIISRMEEESDQDGAGPIPKLKSFSCAEGYDSAIKHYYQHYHNCGDDNPCKGHLVRELVMAYRRLDKQSGRKIKRAKPMKQHEMQALHSYIFQDARCALPMLVRMYIWAVAVVCFKLWLRIDEALELQYSVTCSEFKKDLRPITNLLALLIERVLMRAATQRTFP